MNARTVETDENSVRNGSPLWIGSVAVSAGLVDGTYKEQAARNCGNSILYFPATLKVPSVVS
jgi:hypothetical protein